MCKKLLLALLVGVCHFGGQVALALDEYVFIFPSRFGYWRIMAEGIEQTGKQLGQKVVVYLTDDDRSAEAQLNTCNTAIERKPRFMALASINVAAGIQCLKKAKENGTIVAELDSSIPFAKAKDAGLDLAFSVGSDNYMIGKAAAQYGVTLFKNNSPTVLIIEGAPGSAQGKARVDGFRDELHRLAPQAKIAASISADWDRMKAMNMTHDLLLRLPKLDLIYAANDQMALGVIEGLRTAGWLGNVPVLGVDGTEEARRAVIKGELSATVAQLPYLVGKRAMELAIEVVAGKPVQQVEVTETPVLTNKVLEEKSAPFFQYIR